MHQSSLASPVNDDFLDEKNRAEDILLGSLGFGEEARLIWVERIEGGYRGKAAYSDGEEFDFASDFELEPLEEWALGILVDSLAKRSA